MKLGRLEKLDLRTFWKREATDFTPWLAQEENIQLLSETIGIELEVQSQEESVGPFSADILCKDTINDHYVLIENQLERTDHTHLGQLMTYAAGLDAVTTVNFVTKAQWVTTSGPSEPYTVALAANDIVVMAGCSSAGSNQGGHRTLDEGTNWLTTGFSLLSKFNSLAINPSTGTIYAGGLACFYQSFDNGANFTNTNSGLSSNTTRDILVDGNNLYASVFGVYLSTNGGFNWSLISPPINSTKMDKIGNTILVGTMTAGVYLSVDNGSNWTNPTAGLPTNITDVKIIGTNLLVSTASGIYISTNNGTSWTLTNLSSPTECIYQVGSMLFAGCIGGGGVYYSNDGGNTWIASNTGLSNTSVYSLTSNSNYLFAGTAGYTFRRPLSDYGILTSITTEYITTKDVTIAPNPTTGILTINQPTSQKSEIEIYNQLGKLIDTKITAGKTSTIDLSNLKKGIYLVRITDLNKNVVSKKIVLQ